MVRSEISHFEYKVLMNFSAKLYSQPVLIGLFSIYAICFLLVKGFIPGWEMITTDFPNYYVSAQVVSSGKDIKMLYDDSWFQEQIKSNQLESRGKKFSPQPPITALVMLPISNLKPLSAKKVWLIISVLANIGTILILRKWINLSVWQACLVMLLMGRALANDWNYGQLYSVTVFLLVIGVWLSEKTKLQYLGGAVIGLITLIKYLPVLVIIYALITKKIKVVVSAVLTALVLILFQFTFFKLDMMLFYFHNVLLEHITGDIPGQGAFVVVYQSWPSFLNFLFVKNLDFNPSPIIDWSFGKQLASFVIYGSVIWFTMKSIVRILKSNFDKTLKDKYILAMLFICGLVLLPAGASYHFLFLVIPLATIVNKKLDIRLGLILALIIAINFLPYPFSSNENILMLIMSYPRLFAISIVFFSFYLFISSEIKNQSSHIDQLITGEKLVKQ